MTAQLRCSLRGWQVANRGPGLERGGGGGASARPALDGRQWCQAPDNENHRRGAGSPVKLPPRGPARAGLGGSRLSVSAELRLERVQIDRLGVALLIPDVAALQSLARELDHRLGNRPHALAPHSRVEP